MDGVFLLLSVITLVDATTHNFVTVRQNTDKTECSSYSYRKDDCRAWHYCDVNDGRCMPCNKCGRRDKPESSSSNCQLPVQCTGSYDHVTCPSFPSKLNPIVPQKALGTVMDTNCTINETSYTASIECSWNGSVPVWIGDFSCVTLNRTLNVLPGTTQLAPETTHRPETVLGKAGSESQSYLAIIAVVGFVFVAMVIVLVLLGKCVGRRLCIKQRNELDHTEADITRHASVTFPPLLPPKTETITPFGHTPKHIESSQSLIFQTSQTESITSTSTTSAYVSDTESSQSHNMMPVQVTGSQDLPEDPPYWTQATPIVFPAEHMFNITGTDTRTMQSGHVLESHGSDTEEGFHREIGVRSAPTTVEIDLKRLPDEADGETNPKETSSNLSTTVGSSAIDMQDTQSNTERKFTFQNERACNKPTTITDDRTDHVSPNSKSYPGGPLEDIGCLDSSTESHDTAFSVTDVPKVSNVTPDDTNPKARPASPAEHDWPLSSVEEPVSPFSSQYSGHGGISMNTLSFGSSDRLTVPCTDLDVPVDTISRHPQEQEDLYPSDSTTPSVPTSSFAQYSSGESGVGTDPL